MSKDDAHLRLLQAIEYLRNNGKARTHQEIADMMGKKQPNVTSAINGDPTRLTKGFLKRFAKAYSEYLNEEWLLTGEGMMERPSKNTRPHIPTQVAAGWTDVAISTVSEEEVEHLPVIVSLPAYDFTIGVMGDSMQPVLSDGDTVACRRLYSQTEIKAKAIYVIETQQGAVVKQIAHVADEVITLHSLNPQYPDYIIPSSTVISISQIVGLIRPLPTR